MRVSTLILFVFVFTSIIKAQPDSIFLQKGVELYDRGEYAEAMKAFQQCAKKSNDNRILMLTYRNIGNVYSQTGQSVEALKNYQQSLKISDDNNDQKSSAITMLNIGALYAELKDFTAAVKQYDIAEQIGTRLNEASILADCANNKGVIYEQQQNYKLALREYFKALNIYKSKNIESRIGLALNNIGIVYKYLGNYEQAINYYTQSKKIGEKLDDKFLVAANIINIGNVYEMMKDYTKAIAYNKKGLDVANQINALNIIVEAAQNISGDYAGLKDYKEAYGWAKQSLILHDSMINADNKDALANLQTKYETEKKEKEIAVLKSTAQINTLRLTKQELLLQKRNYQMLGIGGAVLLISIIVFLLYNSQQLKQKQLREKAVLDAEYKERMRIARDVHDDLGSGLSRISLMADMAHKKVGSSEPVSTDVHHIADLSKGLIENMRDLIWVLNPENISLEHLVTRIREFCSDYLEEKNMKFQMNIPVQLPSINISRELQRNIFLTIKESVHNAVKHADATLISITIAANQDAIDFAIRDNGKGFHEENTGNGGNGLKNMQQRIKASGGKYTIHSIPGTGTEVSFSIAQLLMADENYLNA